MRKLAKKLKSPIICLIGPPGVGKTSLAKSVARSPQREFVRISLGGYGMKRKSGAIAAPMWAQCRAGSSRGCARPELPIPPFDGRNRQDEHRFSRRSFGGAAGGPGPRTKQQLQRPLHCLPFDLSKVLFITTANAQHPIPQPLQDRMEIIYISGYTEEEKVEIVRRHLLPKLLKEHGLSREQMKFSQHAVRAIIRHYTREAGVRDLERHLARVCRKVAGKWSTGMMA